MELKSEKLEDSEKRLEKKVEGLMVTKPLDPELEAVTSIKQLLELAYEDKDYTQAWMRNATKSDVRLDSAVRGVGREYSDLGKALNHTLSLKLLNPLAQVPLQERPKARIILGKPGSGKSTYTYGSQFEEVKIDPDRIVTFLPGYSPQEAPVYLGWAADVGTLLMEKAMVGRYNLCVDLQGVDPAACIQIGEGLVQAGYDLHVVMVDVSTLTILKRVYGRFKDGGRFLDLRSIAEGFSKRNGPREVYERLKKIAITWIRLTNDPEDRVLEEGSRDA